MTKIAVEICLLPSELDLVGGYKTCFNGQLSAVQKLIFVSELFVRDQDCPRGMGVFKKCYKRLLNCLDTYGIFLGFSKQNVLNSKICVCLNTI